jgi:cell division transport system ATP-binding protein
MTYGLPPDQPPAPLDRPPRHGLAVRLRSIRTADGILAGVDLEAPHGAVTTICGGPHAGKSTLIDVMRLAKEVSEGEGWVLEAPITRLKDQDRAALKRRIGVLSQSPRLLDHLSVFDNVALPMRLAGAQPQDFGPDVEDLLDFVGLQAVAGRPAGELSQTERRRAAAARAVAHRPELVLADEPCAGLGPDAAAKMLKLLLQMRKTGAAVVIATQDMALADSLGGTILRLDEGRVTFLTPERTG